MKPLHLALAARRLRTKARVHTAAPIVSEVEELPLDDEEPAAEPELQEPATPDLASIIRTLRMKKVSATDEA